MARASSEARRTMDAGGLNVVPGQQPGPPGGVVADHEWSCDLRAVGGYRLMGCSISKSPRRTTSVRRQLRETPRETHHRRDSMVDGPDRPFWWRYARAVPGGRDAFGPGETGRSSLRCRRVLVSSNLVGIEVGWIRICRGGSIEGSGESVNFENPKSAAMHVPFGNVC